MLNPSKIEYVDFNCNHFKGCWHNCQYPCYARTISREKEERWIQVRKVENACELIGSLKEIRKMSAFQKKHGRPGVIMVSSMCDPYPPIEEAINHTNQVLRSLLQFKYHLRILTKSSLVMRDAYLFKGEYKPLVKVGFTIITLDDELRAEWEPNASPIEDRIKALKSLHDSGVYTWVSVEPIIIGTTNPIAIIEELFPWVDEFIFGKHNYNYNPLLVKPAYVKIRQELIRRCEWLKERDHIKSYLIKKELREIPDVRLYQSFA